MTNEDLVEKVSGGKVQVLRAGEGSELPGGLFYAPSTITLVRDVGETYNIVDVGCFGEEELVENLLKERNISPTHIQRVLITHNHPDHIGTTGLFKVAEIYMPDSIFHLTDPNVFRLMGDDFMLEIGKEKKLTRDSDVSLISTPGHAGWDMSVLYRAKKNGKSIAMVGDLFWSQKDWEDGSEYINLCVNKEMQDKSREYVKNVLKPDVVVPGHGHAFSPVYEEVSI